MVTSFSLLFLSFLICFCCCCCCYNLCLQLSLVLIPLHRQHLLYVCLNYCYFWILISAWTIATVLLFPKPFFSLHMVIQQHESPAARDGLRPWLWNLYAYETLGKSYQTDLTSLREEVDYAQTHPCLHLVIQIWCEG